MDNVTAHETLNHVWGDRKTSRDVSAKVDDPAIATAVARAAAAIAVSLHGHRLIWVRRQDFTCAMAVAAIIVINNNPSYTLKQALAGHAHCRCFPARLIIIRIH